MKPVVLATCLAACGIGSVLAQQSPAFEAVSVRRSPKPLMPGDSAQSSPDLHPSALFERSHATVAGLIRFAYDLQAHQLVGAPRWAQTESFEVKARAATEVPVEQIRLMVRSLLAERFSLVTRNERRNMNYLALVTTRSDGLPGPYLRRVADECTPAAIVEAQKQFPPREGAVRSAGGRWIDTCGPLSTLVRVASVMVDDTIIDRTGLTGNWTFQAFILSFGPTADPSVNNDRNWASLQTALRDQLGLKFERTRSPIDVLVVDSVKRPANK